MNLGALSGGSHIKRSSSNFNTGESSPLMEHELKKTGSGTVPCTTAAAARRPDQTRLISASRCAQAAGSVLEPASGGTRPHTAAAHVSSISLVNPRLIRATTDASSLSAEGVTPSQQQPTAGQQDEPEAYQSPKPHASRSNFTIKAFTSRQTTIPSPHTGQSSHDDPQLVPREQQQEQQQLDSSLPCHTERALAASPYPAPPRTAPARAAAGQQLIGRTTARQILSSPDCRGREGCIIVKPIRDGINAMHANPLL